MLSHDVLEFKGFSRNTGGSEPTENPGVPGSTPGLPTNKEKDLGEQPRSFFFSLADLLLGHDRVPLEL
jgi:hypothetical protein